MFAKDTLDKQVFINTLFMDNNAISKWAKNFRRHLTKKDIQMAKMHMERCSTSYVIRGMQIETIGHHDTSIRMATIWNTDSTKW